MVVKSSDVIPVPTEGLRIPYEFVVVVWDSAYAMAPVELFFLRVVSTPMLWLSRSASEASLMAA